MQEAPLLKQQDKSSPGIRAVILDYGQVLAGRPTNEEFGRMAAVFDVSFAEFYELWEASRNRYDRGDLTAEEYWRQLATQMHTPIDQRQIAMLRKVEVEIWCHTVPAMLDWVRQLRAAGIKTGLLSNMPWDLITHLRTNSKWLESFVFHTFSAEVRLIKPEPAIFEHTLRGLRASAAETLFVDDRAANIQAAHRLGIRGIQFHSTGQLREELEFLGFPILPPVSESSAGTTVATPPNGAGPQSTSPSR